MSAPVVFVDTETTGLHPTNHEVWEVGLILPEGIQRQWFLPVNLANADPFALDVGRFHERHPHGYRYEGRLSHVTQPEVFAKEFVRLTDEMHLVGACISFDAERLGRLVRKAGYLPSWHYHLVDVEALAAGAIAMQALYEGRACIRPDRAGSSVEVTGAPPWDSSALSRAVGIEPDDFDRHTALGDCRWARAIYKAVLDPYAEKVAAE